MYKTNSQFQDKYDIKSFEHTTVLMSALHNVYQSKHNHAFVYLWNYLYSVEYLVQSTRICPNTLNPYSALVVRALDLQSTGCGFVLPGTLNT